MRFHSQKRMFPGLAQKARALRLARGLSQQVAATRGSMSQNRLRDVERYGLATIETLTRLARVLAVDVDVLTGRREGSS